MDAGRAKSMGVLGEIGRLVWPTLTAGTKARFALAFALVMLMSVLTAAGPVALQRAVDGFTAGRPPGALPEGAWIGLYVLSQWFARSIGEIRGLVYARAERRVLRRLGERFFAHLLQLPLRFHLQRQTGAVLQGLTNGLQGYQTVLHALLFSFAPVGAELATVATVLARLGQPMFLAIFCAAIGCYAAAFARAARRTLRSARQAATAQAQSIGAMTDALLNYETVKYFCAERVVAQSVAQALEHSETQWVLFYRQFATNGLLVATLYATFLISTLYLAAWRVGEHQLTIGQFVLVNTYMLQILRPVETLGYAVQGLAQGIAFLGTFLELQRIEPESAGDAVTRCTPPRHLPVRGELEFRDVWFSYTPGDAVLKGVSFRVPVGGTLGIVGASGSGKSTIVRLLTRLLEPDRGEILLDGVKLREWPLTRLRAAIAVVPQDTVLFDQSIRDNILLGRCAAASDVEAAARRADVDGFVRALPQGYETRVGERGVKLSGGERQRIAIARAALQRPAVYVGDEATASLDSATEMNILRALSDITAGVTTLMIAHRLSTVIHADEIIVLERGVVAERGTHESLLATNGRYASLWRTQLRGFATRRKS